MAASRFPSAWRPVAAALAVFLVLASPGLALAQMGPGDAYDPEADDNPIQVDPATIPGMEHMMSRHGKAPSGQGPS